MSTGVLERTAPAIAEENTTREIKVFGEHEQRPVPVQELVVMPQVRSGLNPELDNIKESVRANGLLNPIDVAVMDEAALSEYIEFTNKLWGHEAGIEDYIECQQPDGTFFLVIAGHTRYEAIRQLEAEQDDVSYSINAKIHNVQSPDEIIALQLEENLHSKPAPERHAMSIVEAYEYGRVHEKWDNPTQFEQINRGRYSRKILAEAIGFAKLPASARDFVFSGTLSYAAAVEIGKSTDVVRDNARVQFALAPDMEGLQYDDLPEIIRTDLDTAVALQFDRLINHIQAEGLKSTKAKAYVQGQVKLLDEETKKATDQLDEEDSLFDYSMIDSDSQRAAYLNDLRRQVQKQHEALAYLEGYDKMLALHAELTGVDTSAARATYERSVQRVIASLGRHGAQLSVAV